MCMDQYWDMLKKEKLHRNVVIFLVAIAFLLGLIMPRSLSLFQNAASPSRQERNTDQGQKDDRDEDEDMDDDADKDDDEDEDENDDRDSDTDEKTTKRKSSAPSPRVTTAR